MKTFAEYLTESRKTFDYRIKIAEDTTPEFMKGFEQKLKQFDVVKMTAPKTTPVQKTLADFPQYNNESMTFMDVTFNYPATPPQITQIAQLLGLDPNRICIQDRVYAERMDVERERQDEESKNLLTDTDFPHPIKNNAISRKIILLPLTIMPCSRMLTGVTLLWPEVRLLLQ